MGKNLAAGTQYVACVSKKERAGETERCDRNAVVLLQASDRLSVSMFIRACVCMTDS